jgi:hypothetical protein
VLLLQQEQKYLKQLHTEPKKISITIKPHGNSMTPTQKVGEAIKLKSKTAVSLRTQLVHLMIANWAEMCYAIYDGE